MAEVRGAAIALNKHIRDTAPNSPIGILIEPGAGWLAAMLAVVASGRIAMPLAVDHPTNEAQRLLTESGAPLVLTSPTLAGRLPDGTTHLIAGDDHAEGKLAALGDPRADDTALMLFTSGTTGRPKGVCITHANIAHQANLLARAWRLDDHTRLLHTLPLHHMHGVCIALFPCLLAGGTTITMPFEAHAVWRALDAHANTFMAVPTIYHKLIAAYDATSNQDRCRAAARSLRLATSGSAALAPDLAERWCDLAGSIPLERYGMTEIGVACSNPFSPDGRRLGSVGPPLPSVQMRLDAEGEVWVRGPSVFAGYWQRPDATAAAFEDGWFRTGDVGLLEDDYLRLRGRQSIDIIKSGGYKLSAIEIEQALRRHPAIDQVAVVGLPDDVWGQRAVAAVVLHTPVDDVALRAWAKTELAPYKVPRAFIAIDELPRNAVGKVVKPKLIAALRSGQPG